MGTIRVGRPEDLPQVAAVQNSSPEASQWEVSDYLRYEFLVLEDADGGIAGFLVARRVAAEEHEILNFAVAPGRRRSGLGRRLIEEFLGSHPGEVFLEVRESNRAARIFYKSMGFQEISIRSGYYESRVTGPEAAIVMKFHSC